MVTRRRLLFLEEAATFGAGWDGPAVRFNACLKEAAAFMAELDGQGVQQTAVKVCLEETAAFRARWDGPEVRWRTCSACLEEAAAFMVVRQKATKAWLGEATDFRAGQDSASLSQTTNVSLDA